ncbi:MAG: redox-sensing transcriptional repressor Rex [Clostridiales bacterium]|jgi:redox-sensing transcriptional repressor|nr:redox-sensing transcriptional repressor Rex [Clostridiales bacterium]
MKACNGIALATFQRLPVYVRALREMRETGAEAVSAPALAERLGFNPSVVKKDLSCAIVSMGKPKTGYDINGLITDIENFLGYNNAADAVLVGVGKLGSALLGYRGFETYGLNIVAGFDADEKVAGTTVGGKKVFGMEKLASIIRRLHVKLAVLTTPKEAAQDTADRLTAAGIRAIWNFTPEQIKTPPTVAVKNENMAASLAVLSKQLKEILLKEAR